MEGVKIKKRRSFGGKTSGFSDPQEKAFEQKHLKAYIKGKKTFKHGFKTIINSAGLEQRVPAEHQVKEVWITPETQNEAK